MKREEAVAYAVQAQQLDRTGADDEPTTAAIFDFGIQDTGRDGASWALANRGFPVSSPADLQGRPDVGLAWTLRGAPHFYRRSDLADVAVATSPFSAADAAKRMVGAGKPLTDAGIDILEGLTEVAGAMRQVVQQPMSKGEVSTALTSRLAAPYLRNCVPCGATHPWEVPFRVAALYGGLELQPGTSPPVLQRIPGWQRSLGPAADPMSAPLRLQPIRNYLRFFGPSTPREVATFLDAPVSDIKRHWPEDATATEVGGSRAWVLDPAADADPPDVVKLLGSHDLLLQIRNRSLLVPDAARHKALWPVIGRPGALLVGTEVAGLWRTRATGTNLTVRLELWTPVHKATRARIQAEAERLADHRGLRLIGIEEA